MEWVGLGKQRLWEGASGSEIGCPGISGPGGRMDDGAR